MNIWDFQRTLTRRLLIINSVNIAAGLAMLFGGAFWRGFGMQAAGWGVINMMIGLVGSRAASRRASATGALEPQTTAREARSLRRLLWANAGLDVLYMIGGWRFAATGAPDDGLRRGNGYGIVIQGALLFVFDLVHALALGRADHAAD